MTGLNRATCFGAAAKTTRQAILLAFQRHLQDAGAASPGWNEGWFGESIPRSLLATVAIA